MFFEIDTILGINRILQGNSLGIGKIGGLSFAQTSIERIQHTLGAFLCAGPAGNAQVHVNVTGGLINRHFKVARLPGQTAHF
jgi:hypothetical protein